MWRDAPGAERLQRGLFGGLSWYAARCDGLHPAALPTPAGLFVMRDTNEPGRHAGRLCAARLEWLGAQLMASEGDMPLSCITPPFRVGIARMDQIPLPDADALWQVLAPHLPRAPA